MQKEKEGKGRKRNGREDRKEKRQLGLPHSKSARFGKQAIRKKEPG
jgi:hypothetical protein